MHKEELRSIQAQFEPNRRDRKPYYQKLEAKRKAFVKRFPPSGIPYLPIEEFVVGRTVNNEANKDTFCYWCDFETRELGDMRGAYAIKFGLYVDKETQEYRYKIQFSDADEALKFINGQLSKLLDSGKSKDLAAIEDVEISDMFKGKVLFLYYPTKYVNIFAESHIDFFLSSIGLDQGQSKATLTRKRESLLDWKNSDDVMQAWSMYEFMDFLYLFIGRPLKGEAPAALRPFLPQQIKHHPETVQKTYIDLEIDDKEKSPKGTGKVKGKRIITLSDFESRNSRQKATGALGEKLVLYAERERLVLEGRADLASKVQVISATDVGAGYDIESFSADSSKRHIEVKTTNAPPTPFVTFELTENQVNKGRNLGDRYYLYIVFQAYGSNPKIWPIKNPMNIVDHGIVLKPSSYRASIATKV